MNCTIAVFAILLMSPCGNRDLALPPSALITVYDTAICGGSGDAACINGNGDGYFASMIEVSDDWYGRMAACPKKYFWHTVKLKGLFSVFCGDNFGPGVDTSPDDNIRIDVFWPVAESGLPGFNYNYFEVGEIAYGNQLEN